MIKEYDAEAKRVLAECYLRQDKNNTECFGNYELMKNSKLQARPIREIICISNTTDTENQNMIENF